MEPRTLIVVVGPTGSGKSALAERLAESLDASLVSADSQQVYRGLDIGTAKPPQPRRRAWAMLDLVNPGEPFSAGDYCRLAAPLCEEAWSQGRQAILAGGTGLYLKALLDGLAEVPAVPEELRRRLQADLDREGLAALAQRLQALDPDLAERIDLANPRRVLRGLEVHAASGQPLSRWQAEGGRPALKPGKTLWLGLDPGGGALELRLRERTQAQLRQGWLAEVEALAARHGDAVVASSAAIGYPELLAHLRGRMSLAEATERIGVRTRQYARRQRTWFRAVPAIRWSGDEDGALALFQTFGGSNQA